MTKHTSTAGEGSNRGIFGRMLGARPQSSPTKAASEYSSALSASSGQIAEDYAQLLEQSSLDNEASLSAISEDLQAIQQLAQGFDAEQRALSVNLAAQLQELKAVQVSTQDYEHQLKQLVEGPIQMLEERVSNRVDLKTWYDEVSRIKTQLHSILTSVNDQHNQAVQLQRVGEAQEKRVMQLENHCHELEQALQHKRLNSDYHEQKLQQTAEQLREQQGEFEQALRQLKHQREQDQQAFQSIQQQLQQLLLQTSGLQKAAHAQDLHQQQMNDSWQSLLEACREQLMQVQQAQAALQKNALQVEALASNTLQQFTETQKHVNKIQAYRETIKEHLRQFQQQHQQQYQQFDAKLTSVDERIGRLDNLLQDTQQAVVLANNARKVAVKFHQDVESKLQDIRNIDESIQASLQKSQQWDKQFMAFEQRVSALVADLDDTNQEEKALLQELSNYRATFAQHYADWTQFKTWCQQLSENLVAAEGQLANEKKVVSDYLAETEKLVKVVRQDGQLLTGQQAVIEKALHQLKYLHLQVNGLLDEHQQGRVTVENLLVSEKALNSELTTQSQQIKTTLQAMTSRLQDFDGLSAQAKQDQTHVRALIHSCQTLIATAKAQENQNSEHMAKISEALQTFKHMQNSFTSITDQYGQMQQQTQALSRELVEGTQQLQALENKVNSSCNVVISLTEREQHRAAQVEVNLDKLQDLQQTVLAHTAETQHSLQQVMQAHAEATQTKLHLAEDLQKQAQTCLHKAEQLREEMQQVLSHTADVAAAAQAQKQLNQQVLLNGEALIQQQQNLHTQVQHELHEKLQQITDLQSECQASLQLAKQANERSSRQQHTLDVDRQQLHTSLADSEDLLQKNRLVLDELVILQQQVASAHERVCLAEQQHQELRASVHSANQSAQQCISDIHQVKQQSVSLLQQSEQVLQKTCQQQQALDAGLVSQQHWQTQYAALAEQTEASQRAMQGLEQHINQELQQYQQRQVNVEQVCQQMEAKFAEQLAASQQMQQQATTALGEVKTAISQYRDVHVHSQNSLIKSEELHTKIAQLLESSKDHAHQVDNMRQQINSEIATLQMIGQQQQSLQQQLSPYVQRFQEMEKHFLTLGEQWSQQMQQAETEQRQQQALNRRCEQLQAQSEKMQASVEHQLSAASTQFGESQQQLQDTQRQLQQSIQAQTQLQQDLQQYHDLRQQLTAEQQRYRAVQQTLQEAHQQIEQKIQSSLHQQAEQITAFAKCEQQLVGVQQQGQMADQRLDRLEQTLEQVIQGFKEFMSTHQEAKNLNKETQLAAKEQRLLLKEMENEIKELKFALKVRDKSPTGYLGRGFTERQLQQSSHYLEESPLAPAAFSSQASTDERAESRRDAHKSAVHKDAVHKSAEVNPREWLEDLAQMDVMEAPVDAATPVDSKGFKGFLFGLVMLAGLLLPAQFLSSVSAPTVLSPLLSSTSQVRSDKTAFWTWPVANTTAPAYYSEFRSGVYLPAALHAPVHAVQAGVVVYTGADLTGLGQVVILQHPHELITVYGNNSKNLVNMGDAVGNGQVIAQVGAEGDAAPALYFEVRYQGQAEDPFLYWQTQFS